MTERDKSYWMEVMVDMAEEYSSYGVARDESLKASGIRKRIKAGDRVYVVCQICTPRGRVEGMRVVRDYWEDENCVPLISVQGRACCDKYSPEWFEVFSSKGRYLAWKMSRDTGGVE